MGGFCHKDLATLICMLAVFQSRPAFRILAKTGARVGRVRIKTETREGCVLVKTEIRDKVILFQLLPSPRQIYVQKTSRYWPKVKGVSTSSLTFSECRILTYRRGPEFLESTFTNEMRLF